MAGCVGWMNGGSTQVYLSVRRAAAVTRCGVPFFGHWYGVKVALPREGFLLPVTNDRMYGLDAGRRGQVTGERKKIGWTGGRM